MEANENEKMKPVLQLRNMRQHPDKLKRVWITNLRFHAPFKISHYAILRHTKYTSLVNSEDSQIITTINIG